MHRFTKLTKLLAKLAAGAIAAGALSAPAGAQRYVLSELAPVSPFGARVWDINDAGIAVGHGLSPSLQLHALLWGESGPVDLTPTNALAEAQGISESGVAAGWARNAAGQTEAARWISGQIDFLGILPGHIGSLAQDVNDAGLVAGWNVTPVGDPVASVWIGGQPQAIGPWQSWAFAVSEAGDVVGRQWVGVDIEAFRWRDGAFTVLPDLGPNHAQAVGVSPAGRISGSAQSPAGPTHAVVWEPDLSLTDLGPYVSGPNTFPAQANDVNDHGVAVGSAIIDPVGEIFFAMVWRGRGAENLNGLIQPGTGWTLFEAQAVNARGEIVGTGLKSGFGGTRSFLLRPDCDGDGVSDLDEIAAGTAHDSNGDGLADACQHCQESLGFGGPGAMRLSICGDELTSAGSAATLELVRAAPGAQLLLVGGLSSQPTPFKGGVLVPVPPAVLVPLAAGPGGGLALPIAGGGGPPVTVIVQAVALAGAGAELSNAVALVLGTP